MSGRAEFLLGGWDSDHATRAVMSHTWPSRIAAAWAA